jgi:hypothetical protein
MCPDYPGCAVCQSFFGIVLIINRMNSFFLVGGGVNLRFKIFFWIKKG